jgi:hypothetical protein
MQNELISATHELTVYEKTKGQKVPTELELGNVETGMDWYTWDENLRTTLLHTLAVLQYHLIM